MAMLIVGNFITEVEAERVKEILEHLVDVPTYYDTNGLIRRMERFSQDGDYLTISAYSDSFLLVASIW